MQYDVVIVSLPYILTTDPMQAPAYLKSIVHNAGLSCYTIDANLEIQLKINQLSPDLQHRVKQWFLHNEFQDCSDTKQTINNLMEFLAKSILDNNPKWIGLSLFSTNAQKFNTLLCQYLRKKSNAKIVLGGFGIYDDPRFKSRPYARILQKAKIIDHYIVGDAEDAFYKLLTNKTEQPIVFDGFNATKDLKNVSHSNWDDYKWDQYKTKRLGIFMNRGCVLKCTFCDIHKIWEKFQFRTAESVFDEITYQIKKTGISDFYFRDNILNASLSEYRKLIKLMADYNQSHEQKITWCSNFNIRSQEQMPERDWELTHLSGCQSIITGAEVLVDSLRFHMGKKWTNEDLDFALSMAKKYKVKLNFCIIVGYINETQEHFEECLQWFENNKHYANDPILAVGIGGTMVVNDLTDLYLNAEYFDITLGSTNYNWIHNETNLTYEERCARKEKLRSKLIELEFNVVDHDRPVG